MNSKVWLIAFAIISILAVGGAGYYAFQGWSKYSEASLAWESNVNTIESLQRRVPYPSEENVAELGEKVKAYEEANASLFETITTFTRELNTDLPNTEFQRVLKDRVQQFREFAANGGMEVTEADTFQLGFDLYSNNLPAPELVPLLDYELEAIDHLLRELVNSKAVLLDSFERDPIVGEPGGAEARDDSVVQKYPIRIRFRIGHNGFQEFINKMANDREFFYILRVLRVENAMIEGPIKLTSDNTSDIPSFTNPDTGEPASYDKLVEWGFPDAPSDQLNQAAAAEGFMPADLDARILMGQENLTVFMVVDITRFLSADELGTDDEEEEETRSRR